MSCLINNAQMKNFGLIFWLQRACTVSLAFASVDKVAANIILLLTPLYLISTTVLYVASRPTCVVVVVVDLMKKLSTCVHF